MQTHNLVQGSQEWHDHRAKYDNASDLPSAAGVSKYKTRDQLMTEYKTGLKEEVSAATQIIFDKGHRFEALARPLAEAIIGKALYPVIGTLDSLGASFDGLDIMDQVNWEHKTLNDSIRACETADDLDEMYKLQMDQQMLLSGAEKTLFSATQWDEYDNLIEEKHLWYTTTPDRLKAVSEIWAQFHKDLETFVPAVVVEKAQAETIKALPVPSVVVRGEITASNLTEITPQFDTYLEGIKTELSTDQDFADAEANAKNCREMAKRIEALQENIIGQMVTVNEANGVLENYKKAFNAIGLRLEKAVKEQKEMLKTQAIMKAKLEYADFVTELNKGISVQLSLKLACPDFAAEIKGVKTLESMQSRINSALANGKVEATTLANDVKSKLAYISESSKGYEHLVNVNAIVFGEIDYIKLHIQSVKDAEDVRKAKHEAAIKEQAEAEARAKIEAEARAKEAAAAKAQAEKQDHIGDTTNMIPADIPEGDAITNTTINQADFNNVFGVKEQPQVQVGSVRPTAQAIINLVATTYKVDAATANRWLAQSFGELKAA